MCLILVQAKAESNKIVIVIFVSNIKVSFCQSVRSKAEFLLVRPCNTNPERLHDLSKDIVFSRPLCVPSLCAYSTKFIHILFYLNSFHYGKDC